MVIVICKFLISETISYVSFSAYSRRIAVN